ncbi:LYR motif-containing protein 4 isoform X2 [Dendrobates tinctorius]|uniref:LYR motif-containing protein 4 isoform X2 n=1 Tax=Dendrobates tinctorius TaxID=92724 RepID=UPI003CC9AFE6
MTDCDITQGPVPVPPESWHLPPPGRGAETYAIRRVRDAFREKKNVDDFHEIQSLIYRAKENLEVIQRQQRGGLQTPIINFIIYCVQKKGIFYLLVDTNTGFYWSCDFHNAIRLQLGNCTPLTS